MSIVDLDLWHEIATAQAILDQHDTSTDLTFSYTPTVNPIVHHEWLTGVVVLKLATWLGPLSLTVLKFFLIFTLAWINWVNAKKTGCNLSTIFITLILAICISDYGFGTIRAQMFTYLYASILFYLINRDRNKKRLLLLIFSFTFPLWINLHGGAIIGILIMLAYAFELALKKEPFLHLILPISATFFLISINPWGVHYYYYLAKALTMERPLISEWLPIYKSDFSFRNFSFLYVILIPILYAKNISWKKLNGLALIALTFIMSVKSVRFMPFFGIALSAYYGNIFEETKLSQIIEQIWVKLQSKIKLVFVFTSIILFSLALKNRPFNPIVPSTKIENYDIAYPVDAINYLKVNDFKGNILCSFNYCSYIIWKLYPYGKVFIDGRYEVAYPEERLIEDNIFFHQLAGWEKILNKYSHDVILINTSADIAKALESDQKWKKFYEDDLFLIFGKENLNLPVTSYKLPPSKGTFP